MRGNLEWFKQGCRQTFWTCYLGREGTERGVRGGEERQNTPPPPSPSIYPCEILPGQTRLITMTAEDMKRRERNGKREDKHGEMTVCVCVCLNFGT